MYTLMSSSRNLLLGKNWHPRELSLLKSPDDLADLFLNSDRIRVLFPVALPFNTFQVDLLIH